MFKKRRKEFNGAILHKVAVGIASRTHVCAFRIRRWRLVSHFTLHFCKMSVTVITGRRLPATQQHWNWKENFTTPLDVQGRLLCTDTSKLKGKKKKKKKKKKNRSIYDGPCLAKEAYWALVSSRSFFCQGFHLLQDYFEERLWTKWRSFGKMAEMWHTWLCFAHSSSCGCYLALQHLSYRYCEASPSKNPLQFLPSLWYRALSGLMTCQRLWWVGLFAAGCVSCRVSIQRRTLRSWPPPPLLPASYDRNAAVHSPRKPSK